MPFQERGYFPETVSRALEAYLQNPAAATCSSPTLSRALRMYDKQQDEVFISEVPFQGYFYWQGHRLFQRLSKQRTRYNALEVDTGRYTFFPAGAGQASGSGLAVFLPFVLRKARATWQGRFAQADGYY